MAVISVCLWAECTVHKTNPGNFLHENLIHSVRLRTETIRCENPTCVRQTAQILSWLVLARCKCLKQTNNKKNITAFTAKASVRPLLPQQWQGSRCPLCSEPSSVPAVQDWAFSQGQQPLKQRKRAVERLWVKSNTPISHRTLWRTFKYPDGGTWITRTFELQLVFICNCSAVIEFTTKTVAKDTKQ